MQAISLLVPVLISGVLFIVAIKRGWLLWLNKPIDLGGTFLGQRIFGDNKNWRGVVFYVLGGTFIVWLLHLAQPQAAWIATVFANEPIALGISTTSAYVAGELLNSFIKRRIGLSPGASGVGFTGVVQRVFDNVDGALASGMVLLFAYQVPFDLLLISFVLSVVVHASTDIWMRWLRLKSK